ncbi:MAG: FixH family protein [Ferruginibacter sp.]
MNWGYKILIVYVIFIAGIVTLVFKSSVQNQDLVVNDYYDQELKYQDKIDAIQRTNSLKSAVECKVENGYILINFPAEMKGSHIDATVLLYSPVDEKKDVQKQMGTDNAVIQFPITAKSKGFHKLKISWVENKTSYYSEQQIILP